MSQAAAPLSVPARMRPGRAASLLQAALQWLLAAGFAAAASAADGPTALRFGALLQLEFLAVHAGLLIGFTVFWQPEPRYSKALRAIALLVFAWLYGFAGHVVDGWAGVAGILGMMVGTHGGLLWSRGAARNRMAIEIGVRWLVAFALLMAAVAFADPADGDIGRWTRTPEALRFGAVYFMLLGVIEASGLYLLIRGTPERG